MLDILWNAGAFILVLGVLITFHEFGHYWVAKRCGVKVLRFSVGFGKALWRKTDRHGTEFVIAAIPLGGYVKMLDERAEEVAEHDKPFAFNRQPVLNRIAILAAGPLANFILAIVAFWLIFLIGMPAVKPVVGQVAENSIAATAGLRDNQIIVKVGDDDINTWEDFTYAFVGKIGHDDVTVQTKSTETAAPTSHYFNLQQWEFDPDKQGVIASLGITPYQPEITPVIARVSEDSPAAAAGLQVGDRLLAIDGEEYLNWQTFVNYVSSRPKEEITLKLERQDRQVELSLVVAEIKEKDGQSRGFVGVSPSIKPWPESYLLHLQYDPWQAFTRALDKTGQLVGLTFDMIGKLITGTVSVKNLSGPISIAQGAGTSADFGFVYLLSFMALISVNLGVINLLPLPVLDGGHLLYYVIELFSGKPLPERVQEMGFRIGALVLFMLMGVAILNDISRL